MENLFLVIVLGIVQGLTEFIPVSSTGHIILVEKLLGSNQDFSSGFFDTFLVMIQLPSIIAVILYFWSDINPFVLDKKVREEKLVLWSKIIIGVLPAAIIGLLFDDMVSSYLSGVKIIAFALIFYGIVFFFMDKITSKNSKINSVSQITYKVAATIGFIQCLAMIPGTSRSGATIIGGLLMGLSRSVAAEFSFFLAIPTMFGATLLRVLKNGVSFTNNEWFLTLVGSLVSFVVSYTVIKWLMNYLKEKDFKIFGQYRIILGFLIIIVTLFK